VETLVGEEKRCLKPKDGFKDCDTCPEMVMIPAGEFIMGSPQNEDGRNSDEGPQHKVTIAKPFAVARFAATRGGFAAFVRETRRATGEKCWTYEDGKGVERAGRSFRNPGFAQDDQHPVVCVNWEDAKALVDWLSKKTAKPYRLLTEAEREYVTRGGTTARYHFGNDEKSLCRYGNGADRTAKSQIKGAVIWTTADCEDGYAHTAPVGKFAANPFGLHDVHGNVWEWVEDCHVASYNGAPTDGTARSSGTCSSRVLRGGSWISNPRVLRSAFRYGARPVGRGSNRGFRVARTL
jgi:formylglycine-generating enzyme required for sulfatase activity